MVAAKRSTDPAQLIRLIQGDLDWIAMKALEKERSRRYETANGLARDIERFLHDEPIEARPPSAFYRLKKLAKKHRGRPRRNRHMRYAARDRCHRQHLASRSRHSGGSPGQSQ